MAVEDVRAFVPALDFALSREFYEAIGWTTVWTDGDGLALMELGGHRFMLQDYYVREWAENFMMAVIVSDAGAWFRRGATVTYVWDPCGVLLHFTQWTSP
jgi:hypothetical protein